MNGVKKSKEPFSDSEGLKATLIQTYGRPKTFGGGQSHHYSLRLVRWPSPVFFSTAFLGESLFPFSQSIFAAGMQCNFINRIRPLLVRIYIRGKCQRVWNSKMRNATRVPWEERMVALVARLSTFFWMAKELLQSLNVNVKDRSKRRRDKGKSLLGERRGQKKNNSFVNSEVAHIIKIFIK